MGFKSIVCFFAGLFIATGAFAQQGGLFTLSGKPVEYKDIIAKEKTVLFLWTTSCPYCELDLKQFNQDCLEGYDAQMVLIDVGDDQAAVNDFVKSMKFKDCLTEHILIDPNLTLSEKFTIIGVPTIIFLRNGRPIYTTYTIDKDLVKEVYSKK